MGRLVVAVAVLTLALAAPAVAATKCWRIGAPSTGGAWHDGGNWEPTGVPAVGDDVSFMAGGPCFAPANVLLSGTGATVKSLTSSGSTSLIVDGVPLNPGSGGNFSGGFLRNGASLTFSAGTSNFWSGNWTADVGAATVTINGSVEISGLHMAQSGTGVLTTNTSVGSVVTVSGGSATLSGALTAHGTLRMTTNGWLFLTTTANSVVDGPVETLGNGNLIFSPAASTTTEVPSAISQADGRVILQGVGTVHVGGAAAFDVAILELLNGVLDLDRNGTAKRILLGATRRGTGTLTVSGQTVFGTTLSQITGGVGMTLDDASTTIINGPLQIQTGASNNAIKGGHVFRTNGTTAWYQGGVELRGGTWVNASTITHYGPFPGGAGTQLAEGPGGGHLHNLPTGTIIRPTGTAGGPLFGTGDVLNEGLIDIQESLFGFANAGGDGGTITQTGSTAVTHVAGGAIIRKTILLQGGILRGSGKVGAVSNTGGTVQPGESPGTLTVEGTFAQSGTGVLDAEIVNATTYDRIVAGGAVTAGGTVNVLNDAGYSPAAESTYDLVTGSARSGQWDNLDGEALAGGSYVGYYTPTVAGLCFISCPTGGPPPSHSLTVSRGGTGTGSISSSPPGIACGGDCSESYTQGTSVTLTATPSGGSTFAGWSGDCTGTGPCVVSMTQARTVTASFTAPQQQTTTPTTTTPVGTPPAETPPPEAPPAQTPPPPVAVASTPPAFLASQVIPLPSAKKCVSRRKFSIRLRIPKGVAVRQAVVKVNGKQVKVVRGSRLTAPVDLRSFVKGRFTVQITVTAADGRVIKGSRKYRTCVPKRASKRKTGL